MIGPRSMPCNDIYRDDACGVRGIESLRSGEERHTPEEDERGARERRGEVRPERETRSRVRPGCAYADSGIYRGGDDADDAGIGVHCHVGTALCGMVADDQGDEDREEHAEAGDAAEGDAPAGGVQECSDGNQGDQLAGLADDAGELDHDRSSLRRKPGRHETQDGGGRSRRHLRRAARVRRSRRQCWGESAMVSWPAAMSNMPIVMIGRDPKRSSRIPTGICMPP